MAAAQIAGTSSTPQRAIDGSPNISIPANAQVAAAGGGLFGGATVLPGQGFAVPGDCAGRDILWDLVFSGTAPGAIEVDLEGSLDQSFTIANAAPGTATAAQLDTTTLVASQMRAVTNKQVMFMRLTIVSMTGGDATTSILGRIYLAKRGSGL